MIRGGLRLQLTLWTAAVVGFAVLCFGVGVSLHLYNDGLADLDEGLKEVANDFFSALGRHPQGFPWDDHRAVQDLFPNVRNVHFVEVIDANAHVLYRSKDLGDAVFPPLIEGRGFRSARLLGKDYRIGVFKEHNLTLQLAGSLYAVEETTEDLLIAYAVALPLVVIIVGVGGRWLARKALAPVEEIAAAAERITAQRLDQRLPDDGRRDEIGHLTSVFNQMIDRLEGSFHQATRFTADASHELKTPLTIIRCELEEALRLGGLAPVQEKMCLNLLDETVRLSTITEGLLLLSRADAGKLQLEMTTLDLSVVLAEMIEDIEILAAPRRLTIEAEIPPALAIRANPQFLRQLLLNLFDNAIKYNCEGGRIRVGTKIGTLFHTISIANTGELIPPERAARIFDRFYRGEASRQRRVAGHGLGLSICREIARAHGGDIVLLTQEPDWTIFQFTLPVGERIVITGSAPELEKQRVF